MCISQGNPPIVAGAQTETHSAGLTPTEELSLGGKLAAIHERRCAPLTRSTAAPAQGNNDKKKRKKKPKLNDAATLQGERKKNIRYRQ